MGKNESRSSSGKEGGGGGERTRPSLEKEERNPQVVSLTPPPPQTGMKFKIPSFLKPAKEVLNEDGLPEERTSAQNIILVVSFCHFVSSGKAQSSPV